MMNPPETDPPMTELWDEIPKVFGTARADVLMELAEHLMEAERHSEAVPVLETSRELYVEAGVDWMAGRVAHNLGVALGHLGREAEQLAAEQESIERFERAQRRDLAGCSRMSLGLHLRKAGHLKEALAAFRAAAGDFADANEPLHRANALLAELEAELDLGRFPAAARLLGPALQALAPVAPVGSVARLHELAAQVFEVRSGPAAAQPILRRARAVWNALDDEDEVAKCDIRSAVLLIDTDGPEAAATTLQSLRPERQEAGDPAGVAACDHGLGLAALARKRPHQALRLFDDAATVFQACGLLGEAAESEALAAIAMVALGRSSDALPQLRRVAPVLAACHRPRAEVDARLALARLFLAAGDAKAALREAKRAESLARRGLLDPQLEQAHLLRNRSEQRVASLSPRAG